jgi:hypothetical protein
MNNRTGIRSTVDLIWGIVCPSFSCVVELILALAVIVGLVWVLISLIRWFWSNPLF